MSAPLRLPLVGLLVLSAGVAGFCLGRITPGSNAAPGGRSHGVASPESQTDGPNAAKSKDAAASGASGQYAEESRLPWTRERIADAGQAILSRSNIFGAIRPMLRLVDSLNLEDMPVALKALEDVRDVEGDEIFAVFLMMRWAELDPADAVEKVKSYNRNAFFNPAQEVIIPAWTQRDPFAALAWAKSISDGDNKKKALELIIQTMARSSVEEALQMARSHAPELVPKEGLPQPIVEALNQKSAPEAARRFAAANALQELNGAMGRWAAKDRPAAMAWARALQDSEQQRAAVNAVISQWASDDIKGAATAFDELAADLGKLAPAANAIARHWPQSDLAGLKQRVAQLPDGAARNEMTGQLAERFGATDPEGGAQWLSTLPSGQARDRATQGYAKTVARKDGGAAMEWALSITNPDMRKASMHEVVSDWFNRDPAEAYAWMRDASELSEEQKQALLRGK